MKIKAMILFLLLTTLVFGQVVFDYINRGNQAYKNGKYEEAAKQYQQGLVQEPTNHTVKYNLATVYFRLHKKQEAIKLFDELLEKDENADFIASIYYNKGVIASNSKQLDQSIADYKNALRKNPKDQQARENLQKALLEKAKQKQLPQRSSAQEPPSPRLNRKDLEQRLNQLDKKEKELREKMNKNNSTSEGQKGKDW